MKQISFQNKFKSLLLTIAVFLIVFIGMWGCSDETLRWVEDRSLGGVVGFVDDSLVIVSSYHYWHEEVEPALSLSYDREGRAHPGLSLYNYRIQLDGPIWSDTLDNSRNDDFEYIKGQLSDSVIWGGDPKTEVSFWKIGEKPHRMKIKKEFDGCSVDVPYITKLRPWLKEKILVLGNKRNPDMEGLVLDTLGKDYCQYAVLDTIQKVITYKRLNANLMWIKQCDDVRAWGKNVYCVVLDNDGEKSLVLKNKKDTIPVPRKFAIGGFWGNMIKMSGNICSINDDIITCSDVIWYGNELKFYQNDEVIVDLE